MSSSRIEQVAKLVKEAGALLLVDAIQAAGKIDIDFATLGADYSDSVGRTRSAGRKAPAQ